MRSLLFFFLMFVSPVFAGVKTPVKALTAIQFDGYVLKAKYRYGGGCQPHQAKVEVETDAKSLTAKVKVFDTSPEPDLCEADVEDHFIADIRTAIEKALLDQGEKQAKWIEVLVTFPPVTSKARFDR